MFRADRYLVIPVSMQDQLISRLRKSFIIWSIKVGMQVLHSRGEGRTVLHGVPLQRVVTLCAWEPKTKQGDDTARLKIICNEFFALNFSPWNFAEWFLSLKVDIKQSKKHKKALGRFWFSRNKMVKLRLSRNNWNRESSKNPKEISSFRTFHNLLVKIRAPYHFYSVPPAILHGTKQSRNVDRTFEGL